jgi:GT2 family glycosyltransferase
MNQARSNDPASPPVSVFLTVLDEERHLADVVAHIRAQDYPGELQIVIAVGPCRDGTRQIADELAAADPRILVVDNPTGLIAPGLNLAIAQADHDILLRVDGHAMIPPDYVTSAVAALLDSGADNVGGVMAAEGETDFERAVARAMTTRLGVGNATFHTGGGAGPALTVYLGTFRRTAIAEAGGYDETMLRAEDWELNHRIRRNGGAVWFTPALQVSYRPRHSLKALARQYFFYGRWRRELMRRHPETVSARYLAPPTLVAAVAGSTILGAIGLATHRRGLTAALSLPVGYLAALVAGSVVTGRGLTTRSAIALPAVYATMHCAWGAGFLLSPGDLAERTDVAAVR